MADEEISRPTSGLVGFDKKSKKLILQLSSLLDLQDLADICLPRREITLTMFPKSANDALHILYTL
jgi:hypothetical protein